MKAWGVFCLISLGGLIEAIHGGYVLRDGFVQHDGVLWGLLFGVSVLGWSWSALYTGARHVMNGILGRRQPLSTTDPRALAAEMAVLSSQISQLRDTATSYDMSIEQSLQRLEERLRRVEQQRAYAPPPVTLGRGQ